MVYQEPQRDASTPTVDYEQLWGDLRKVVAEVVEQSPEDAIRFSDLFQTMRSMEDQAQFSATAEVRERLASL
jgi:hypothetical protein